MELFMRVFECVAEKSGAQVRLVTRNLLKLLSLGIYTKFQHKNGSGVMES